MQPDTYREGSTNNEASEDSEADTQSGGQRWAHIEDLCAILHDSGCNICEDWEQHHEGETPEFIRVQEFFLSERDERLESTRMRLEQGLQEDLDKIEMLRSEIQDAEAKIKRQLQAETKGMRQNPPSNPPSHRPEPSSHRPRKRQRRTRRTSQRLSAAPSQAVQEIISIDSDSDPAMPSKAAQEPIYVSSD
jgi:exonuclease VII large subunit